MLTHQGTRTLTTPRLTLDRFTPEDAQAMYDGWASAPRVTRFLTWTPHACPELTRQLLEDWCARYARADYYNWACLLYTSKRCPTSAWRHFPPPTGSSMA